MADVQSQARLYEMARDVMLGTLDGFAQAFEVSWAPLDSRFEQLRAHANIQAVNDAAAEPNAELSALQGALNLTATHRALDRRQAADKIVGCLALATQLLAALAAEREETMRDVLLSLPPLPDAVSGNTLH